MRITTELRYKEYSRKFQMFMIIMDNKELYIYKIISDNRECKLAENDIIIYRYFND